VYHVGFLPTVAKVLNCICIKCGRLRQPRTEDQKKQLKKAQNVQLNRRRLNEIVKVLKKVKECTKDKDPDAQ
jgi:DNA-directed RNA polymerase beta' subunit